MRRWRIHSIEAMPDEAAAIEGFNLPLIECPDIDILVDGEAQRLVVAYSVPDGWIEKFSVDEAGEHIITEQGDLARERCKGVVSFQTRDETARVAAPQGRPAAADTSAQPSEADASRPALEGA